MTTFKQFLTTFRQSNRPKHILGGFVVGLCAGSPYAALYTAAIAGACLEFKDYEHGAGWDNLDLTATIIGGAFAALLHLIL